MNIQAYILAINFLITLKAGISIGWRSEKPEAKSLIILYLAISFWSLCIFFYENLTFLHGNQEISYPYLIAGIFFFSTVAGTALLTFTLFQTNRGNWINPTSLVIFGIIPVLAQVIFWATPWRNFLFGDQIVHFVIFSTVWGKANALYLFCLVSASVLFSLDNFIRRLRSQRSGSGFILLCSLLPFIILLLILFGIGPFTDLMPTPL